MSSKKAEGVMIYCSVAVILEYLKNIALQGLNNCMHVPVYVHTIYPKVPQLTRKNVPENFEIPLILTILERYNTAMFYYYFIATSFVVHL